MNNKEYNWSTNPNTDREHQILDSLGTYPNEIGNELNTAINNLYPVNFSDKNNLSPEAKRLYENIKGKSKYIVDVLNHVDRNNAKESLVERINNENTSQEHRELALSHLKNIIQNENMPAVVKQEPSYYRELEDFMADNADKNTLKLGTSDIVNESTKITSDSINQSENLTHFTFKEKRDYINELKKVNSNIEQKTTETFNNPENFMFNLIDIKQLEDKIDENRDIIE